MTLQSEPIELGRTESGVMLQSKVIKLGSMWVGEDVTEQRNRVREDVS